MESKTRHTLRTLMRTVLGGALIFAAFPADAQRSNDDTREIVGGILGALLKGAEVDNATKAWGKVDAQVQDCFARRTSVTPRQLAQEGRGPTDRQVAPHIQYCTRFVEAERFRTQQELAAAETARRAAEERAEQQRQAVAAAQADAEAAEKARAEQAEREKQERLAAEAKIREALVQKYGREHADAILAHRVVVGMSKEAVREARGAPSKVDTIAAGEELWSYGSERIVLVNGKVTFLGN